MSALFFDGPASSFDKTTDKAIEDLTTSFFIEYITEDLSKENPKNEWTQTGQSLLDDGNEKFGISRLHEALQCCMWSNMAKITTQPSIQKLDEIIDQDKKIQELKQEVKSLEQFQNLQEEGNADASDSKITEIIKENNDIKS